MQAELVEARGVRRFDKLIAAAARLARLEPRM
jgi:hypothetical protein